MPIQRRSFRRAAPRRSFGRRFSRRVGTTPPRMQQMQFSVQFDFFVQGVESPTVGAPAFNIQAMMPWENVSLSGYDRSVMLRGIVFGFNVFTLSVDTGGGETPGLSSAARAFMPLQSEWFVDAYDKASGAPLTYLTEPYGPFKNNPPIIQPGDSLDADHSVIPQRVLKRKFMRLKVGNAGSVGVSTGGDNDAGGLTRASWEGVIRKRISIDDKQTLFWAIHALSPFSTGIDVFLSCWLNGVLYYTVRR